MARGGRISAMLQLQFSVSAFISIGLIATAVILILYVRNFSFFRGEILCSEFRPYQVKRERVLGNFETLCEFTFDENGS